MWIKICVNGNLFVFFSQLFLESLFLGQNFSTFNGKSSRFSCRTAPSASYEAVKHCRTVCVVCLVLQHRWNVFCWLYFFFCFIKNSFSQVFFCVYFFFATISRSTCFWEICNQTVILYTLRIKNSLPPKNHFLSSSFKIFFFLI